MPEAGFFICISRSDLKKNSGLHFVIFILPCNVKKCVESIELCEYHKAGQVLWLNMAGSQAPRSRSLTASPAPVGWGRESTKNQ